MLQSSTHFRCSPLDLHQFANLSCTKCTRIGDNTLDVDSLTIRVGRPPPSTRYCSFCCIPVCSWLSPGWHFQLVPVSSHTSVLFCKSSLFNSPQSAIPSLPRFTFVFKELQEVCYLILSAWEASSEYYLFSPEYQLLLSTQMLNIWEFSHVDVNILFTGEILPWC